MAFGNESSAAKSARVKLQLRDKKGRWIEMGGGVKWYSPNLGKFMFGKVIDNAGNGNAKVQVDVPGSSSDSKPLIVDLPASQLEKIKSKATIATPGSQDKIDPSESIHSKSTVEPKKETDNSLFEAMHKNSATSDDPFGPDYEEVPFDPKGTNTLEKNDLVLFTEEGVFKKGHVIGFQDGKPIVQPEVSPAWGFGGKGKIQPLVNINALFKPVGSDANGSKSPEIDSKDKLIPEAEGKELPVVLPALTPEEKEENESSKADSKEEADKNTEEPEPVEDGAGSSGNVKASSNEQNSPGSFYVESRDGSPLVTDVSALKKGDKVYPVGTPTKPYGTHGNYNPKGTHVNLDHPAGLGTVTKTGPNYASVEGEDGKTYYPTNKFVAMKVTPDTEKALGQVAGKPKGPAISQAESDAIQADKDNITKTADNLLENGISPTANNSEKIQSLVDAEEGSSYMDGPGISDPSSNIIYKKKPDGTWISLGGTSKSSEELVNQVPDGNLLTADEYMKYQTAKYMTKLKPGDGVSDKDELYVKNVNGTWSNIKDENTELSVDQVSNQLSTDGPLNVHTPEEVEASKKELTPDSEQSNSTENSGDQSQDTPVSSDEGTQEVFGKVYSDDQGEYMVGSNGAKFRKGEKVLTSKGKGEEAEILALYEGVESARVLLPNGKKSIKKINTLVHSKTEPEADSELPGDTPAEVPNVPESGYDESMLTNPALDDDTDSSEPEITAEELPELEQAAGPIDVSSWKKLKSSSGSNPGGEYEAPDGTHYFVKQSKSDRHAKNEVLASDIYLAAGINSLELGYANVDGNGKLGTIAPMLDGSKDDFQSMLNDPEYKKNFQEGWAVDAWLGNWDVAGLYFDNALTDANGQAIRVDPGGALLFRAMGSPKSDSMFTDSVTEWDSMRTDVNNSQTYAAFNDMTDQQIVDSVDKVAQFSDADIDALVDKNNFDEADSVKLKQKLKARRDDLVDRALNLNLTPTSMLKQADEIDNKTPEADASETPNTETVKLVDQDIKIIEDQIKNDLDNNYGTWFDMADSPSAYWTVGENGLELRPNQTTGSLNLYDANDNFIDSFSYPLSTVERKVLLQHANNEIGPNGEEINKDDNQADWAKPGADEAPLADWEKELLTPAQTEDDGSSTVEEDGLAQWEKDLLEGNPVYTEDDFVVPEEEVAPEVDYSKPGTTYKSPYNGEDTVTGKNGKPIFKGVTVSYTKKGETKEGKVGNILFNQQSASVNWPDGSHSIVKGSQLSSKEEAQATPTLTPSAPEPAFTEPNAPTGEAVSDVLWTEASPDPSTLPVGTAIQATDSDFKLTKVGSDKWESLWGTSYSDDELNQLKDANYKLVMPEISGNTEEVSVPEVTPVPVPNIPVTTLTPGQPESWMGNINISAKDVPVGTTLENATNGAVYKKINSDSWKNIANDNEYSSAVMDSLKGTTTFEGGSNYKITVPGEGATNVPAPTEDIFWTTDHNISAVNLPIGTVLGDKPNSGYKKTGNDKWTSGAGTGAYDFTDEHMDDALHDYETATYEPYYKIFLPEGVQLNDISTTSKPKLFNSLETSAIDLPIGTKLTHTGTIITKKTFNTWVSSNYGLEYTNNEIGNLTKNEWSIELPEKSEDSSVPQQSSDTTSQDDIDNAVDEIVGSMSQAVDDYFDTYQENASWDNFAQFFDEDEIQAENEITIDGNKYFVVPISTTGPDFAFELLNDALVPVAQFKSNSAYSDFNPSYFKYNLLKAIESIPPTEKPVTSPEPVKDSLPGEISIATVNATLNDFISEIQNMGWSSIKGMEPASFATPDGEKIFFLQAHPMSTPYFSKFQLIDEEGKEIPTEKELMWEGTFGEAQFTGQDILDALEKALATELPVSETFDLSNGTKLSNLDYKEFAALPAGTQIKYHVNGQVYGTYLKNENNSWRFQQVNKEKPSHLSDSNADFKFIMDNNKELAENYQIFAPEVPKDEVDVSPVSEEKKYTFSNLKVDSEILDSYPAGTTVKTEESSYMNQKKTYVFEKNEDGTWKRWKKGSNSFVHENTLDSEAVANQFNWNGKTASVSIPQSSDSVMLGNGELAYVGSQVSSGDSVFGFTIEKINKSYINLIDSDGNKVKIPAKKLFMDSSYGTKVYQGYNDTSSKYDPSTNNPLANHLANAKAEKAAADALKNFAGADAAEYDAQGLGIKVGKSAFQPKSVGLSVIDATPPDTSSPLYGQPKPKAPESPNDYPSFDESVLNDLPKWDSAEWLKLVEERYAANPNKKFSSVQESTYWGKIQTVMEGNPGWDSYLDALLGSKYLDQNMYDMAADAIKKQEIANKPLKKAHNENVAKEKEEYEAKKLMYLTEYNQKVDEYTKATEEWSKVNTNVTDIKKLPTLPPASTVPFTGGTADWTKAHPGTFSVQSIMESMKNDNVLGRFGVDAAVGSERIEDNTVSFQKVLSTEGVEKFEVSFKVTHAYGELLNNKFKADVSIAKSNGIYYNHKTNMMGKADDQLAQIKGKPTDSKFVNDGNRFEFKDSATGAKVVFQHSTQSGQNISINNNAVQILMDIDSTPADLQAVIDNLGVNAKPSTAGDLRVTAENKLMTLFSSKSNWGDHNFSGEQRAKTLKDIKEKYNVTVDDIVVEYDANGHLSFFLSDAKADELTAKFPVKHFQHSVYAGEDLDVWESILSGTNPGLLANYHRGNFGVGVLKSGSGMSPDKDMAVGSGGGIFITANNSIPSSAPYGNYVGISAKSVIRRLDTWANYGDNYGKKDKNGASTFDIMSSNGSFHEITMRDTVPLSDFTWITLSEHAKSQLIKRLTDKGIFMINGITLEKFIISTGDQVPVYQDVNKMGVEAVDIVEAIASAPAVGGPAV